MKTFFVVNPQSANGTGHINRIRCNRKLLLKRDR